MNDITVRICAAIFGIVTLVGIANFNGFNGELIILACTSIAGLGCLGGGIEIGKRKVEKLKVAKSDPETPQG